MAPDWWCSPWIRAGVSGNASAKPTRRGSRTSPTWASPRPSTRSGGGSSGLVVAGGTPARRDRNVKICKEGYGSKKASLYSEWLQVEPGGATNPPLFRRPRAPPLLFPRWALSAPTGPDHPWLRSPGAITSSACRSSRAAGATTFAGAAHLR